MCPTNSKAKLCSHTTDELRALFAQHAPRHPDPLQVFCLEVVVETLRFLLRVRPVLDPHDLDRTLGTMAPGQPLPELLCTVRLFEPVYLNGVPFFRDTTTVYMQGISAWVARCVDAGLLRRGGGDGGSWEWDEALVDEWERGEGRMTRMTRWVEHHIWKEPRIRLLRALLSECPADPDLLSPRERQLFTELRDLCPRFFLAPPPPPPPPSSSSLVPRPRLHPRLPGSPGRGDTVSEEISRSQTRIREHRKRAHRHELILDEITRAEANKEHFDAIRSTLDRGIDEEP